MTFVSEEIESQPELWRRAAATAADAATVLPERGARVALFGCGTSLYVAQAIGAAREAAGHGETDAFPASEMPRGRRYDLAVAVSRSGTTTEVVELTRRLRASIPVLAITAQDDGPLGKLASRIVTLGFADERSVVQTRFATCTVALFRAHLGERLERVVADGERALSAPLPVEPEEIGQLVFLGRSASVGLAHEAALKVREAAQAWSEAYPAMEYRHGPISVADDTTVVWALEPLPEGLEDEITATGARVVNPQGDPLAELVRAQRLAVELALARGLDPDRPRNLTRSVVLEP
ncbi:MAG: SIS domain-containing protein [Solirubrobacterales bacterium]|nr:SIS domain-containing protein [Solirubrobacterales bacterium]MBV9808282.1 SIS domain-containing protein [Solirubrobacterales bacterium]